MGRSRAYQPGFTAGAAEKKAANRLGLDYVMEAMSMPQVGGGTHGIVDIHNHITGPESAAVFAQVAELFGVHCSFTMCQLAQAENVRNVMGDRVKFIAFPSFAQGDRFHAHAGGYAEVIETFHTQFGSRMLKLWNSPRLRDMTDPKQWLELCAADAPWRVKACEVGERLGMSIMIHIADPDTWFATKYSDAKKYETKKWHYEGLERMLDRFQMPWIAAHMGGWPEDLAFLDGMLTRHSNLYIDTSATKWVVRELSRHEPAEIRAFFIKWKGRIAFGSDIVASEDHLHPAKATGHPMGDLADSPEAAFELYASRYWALRVLFETRYNGESPIADPDLAMTEPTKYDAMSAPTLRGMSLPSDVLAEMYWGVAERVFGA